MVILGIDPGTTRIGYGAVRVEGARFTHITSGLFNLASKGSFGEELLEIERELRRLLAEVKPGRAGVEQLYFFKNQKTAMRVAEARGVILKTLAEFGVSALELTPLQVKLGVAGSGSASKKTVASMVFQFLGEKPWKAVDDVTDALAVAIAASGRWGVDFL